MNDFAWLLQTIVATGLGSLGGGFAAYVAIKSKIAQHDIMFESIKETYTRTARENDEYHKRLEQDLSKAHERIDRLMHDKILEIKAITRVG